MEQEVVDLNFAIRYLATQNSDVQKQAVATDGCGSISVCMKPTSFFWWLMAT